jgi:CubicO group peptidase (beta-lactamase class C family)
MNVTAKRDYWPTTKWQTAKPEAVGMSSAKLGELDTLLQSRHRKVKGLVVVRKGYIVFEWYGPGCGTEDTHNVASVTKSVISALVGIAIETGFIRSVDQRVLEFFPEYVAGAGDLQKRTLTLRHLLTMTAPVAWKTGAWGYEPLNRLRRQRNWVQYILDLLGRSGHPCKGLKITLAKRECVR